MPSRRSPSPPWIAESLLWLLLRRADWRDTIVGDLREEYAARLAGGRLGAAVWFWRETLLLMLSGPGRLGSRPSPAHDEAPDDAPGRPGRGRARLRRVTADAAQDVGLALRRVRSQPGFSAAVIVTVALGLGATAAIFSVMDGLVLRVLRAPDMERLVGVSERTPLSDGFDRGSAPANLRDWQARSTSFDYMGAWVWRDTNLADPARTLAPERVGTAKLSAGLLEVLGASATAGRLLHQGDDTWGAARVAVISHELWRQRFDGRSGVVGQTLLLDDEPHTIVGIVREGFLFPYASGVWTPLRLSPEEWEARGLAYLRVVGRLRADVSLESARRELTAISDVLGREYPDTNRSVTAAAVPIREAIRDEGGPMMIGAWQAAAVFVLLIACINVVQLLLARGHARRREYTVRVALGAGLGRLVRQLVTEGLVLGALAGAASLGVTWLALKVLRAGMPHELTRYVAGWEFVAVDARLVLFTLGTSAVVAMLFSVLPALQATRVDLNETLARGGRSAVPGGHRLGSSTLICVEIACALVLTVATALSVKGASALLFESPGYEGASVLTATYALPDASYVTPESRLLVHQRVLEGARRLPALQSTALVNAVPSGLTNTSRPVVVDGRPPPDPSSTPRADYRVVSPAYFDTLRIPVVAGRPFTDSDGHDAQRVAIVSEAFVRRYWSDADPVGRRFRGQHDEDWLTVVGVVGDVVHHWFSRRAYPTYYRPLAQDPRPAMSLVLRANGAPGDVAADVREVVAQVDPHLPLFSVQPLDQLRATNLTGLRYMVGIMTVFAVLAVVLACVGIYGVMARAMAEQQRELGLRVALGATSRDIVRVAGRRTLRVTGIGVALGLAGAYLVGRVLAGGLFGLVTLDVGTYAVTAGLLVLVAVGAGLIPAFRATRVDPATYLRML